MFEDSSQCRMIVIDSLSVPLAFPLLSILTAERFDTSLKR